VDNIAKLVGGEVEEPVDGEKKTSAWVPFVRGCVLAVFHLPASRRRDRAVATY
jgi:hypothetical protein